MLPFSEVFSHQFELFPIISSFSFLARKKYIQKSLTSILFSFTSKIIKYKKGLRRTERVHKIQIKGGKAEYEFSQWIQREITFKRSISTVLIVLVVKYC